MDLRGRNALVTGASQGLGEALARQFAQAGARLILVARSLDRLGKLASELGGVAVAADLSDLAQARQLIDRAQTEGGPIDVLVNNAGADFAGAFTETPFDDIEDLFRLDLVAPVVLCRAVLSGMLARGRGHIVNVSSLAGVAALPGLACYSSAKAGLDHFTSGLRADLRGCPVGTTLVELGPVRTAMYQAANGYPPTARSFRRLLRLQLLTETGPEEVAGKIVMAVQRNQRHVRLPRRAALFPVLAEAPRRALELLLAGLPGQG